MSLRIERNDISKVKVDAIVLPANPWLEMGRGSSATIYRAAGEAELSAACDKIGYVDYGHVVMTDGFNLPAKYIMHAVLPYWDNNDDAPEQLYSCYRECLERANRCGFESIAFPLLSSGNFKCPKEQSLKIANRAIDEFFKNYGYELEVRLVLCDGESFETAKFMYEDIEEYIDNNYVCEQDARVGGDAAAGTEKTAKLEEVTLEAFEGSSADASTGVVSAGSSADASAGGHFAGTSADDFSEERLGGITWREAAVLQSKREIEECEGDEDAAPGQNKGASAEHAEECEGDVKNPEGADTSSKSWLNVGRFKNAIRKYINAESAGSKYQEDIISARAKEEISARVEEGVEEEIPEQALSMLIEKEKVSSSHSDDATLDDMTMGDGENFHEAFERYVENSEMKSSEIYGRANITKSLYSKIMCNNDYRPRKETIIALAFAMELGLEDTEYLLMKAGHAMSDCSKFDVICRYFFERNIFDVFAINETLYDHDQPLLGSNMS